MQEYIPEILNRRGFNESQLGSLANQMQAYNAGNAPFDLPFTAEHFSVKDWWRSIGSSAHEVVSLAVFLYDIVPHAGSTERVFSIMGWYNSPRRNKLQVASLAMMTAIRSDLQLRVPKKQKAPLTRDDEVIEVGDVDLLEAPVLDSFEAVAEPEDVIERLESFYHGYLNEVRGAQGQAPQSFTELLLSTEQFVMHPQFDPSYKPVHVAPAPASIIGDLSGSIRQVDANAFVNHLFASMGQN